MDPFAESLLCATSSSLVLCPAKVVLQGWISVVFCLLFHSFMPVWKVLPCTLCIFSFLEASQPYPVYFPISKTVASDNLPWIIEIYLLYPVKIKIRNHNWYSYEICAPHSSQVILASPFSVLSLPSSPLCLSNEGGLACKVILSSSCMCFWAK